MATRRPASSRSKMNPPAMHPPAFPRSRSVLAKSSSSEQQPTETNIRVVVRCRGRSEAEIVQKSPVIVTSNGAKSTELEIEVAAPVSSLGIVGTAPQRTYPFDLVFGPEADQTMIYQEVVSPMLEEVIKGYNCTLFAYGQTGTGKTHTMAGDLVPTHLGNPSPNAGVIPRVLFRLFHYLEHSGTDYSVKISYIEIYNEELRDLLATDLSAPTGHAQPMGMSKEKSNAVELKLFDDAGGNSVIIQGLEEIPVKDSKDALALLTRGSDRRQVAATKFNEHSSRSHSVFTITVHIKETSAVGDDLLKIGKLNLVDLAGSEDINRSGAQNTRAKEAGNINKSLLTLGRVIDALVDKAQRTPYRDSKLTRILKDSLGGGTKTCIIATVSPARCNMEETLSTLDYALRAKSIRNKPELNQRVSRATLIKEYLHENERLKAELMAARDKNGIYITEEGWAEVVNEREIAKTELAEAKKEVAVVENRARALADEYDQCIGLLKMRDGEIKECKSIIQTREGELKEARERWEVDKTELKATKIAFEEEVVVRQAFQQTENVLDTVAGGLKKVATASIKDVGSLFEKLNRKSAVFTSNSAAVRTHGTVLSSTTSTLTSKLNEYIKSSLQTTTKLRSEVERFQTKELSVLSAHSARVDEQLQRATDALTLIEAKSSVEAESLDIIQKVVKEMQETFRAGFLAWSESLKKTSIKSSQEVGLAGKNGFNTVEEALNAMYTLVEAIVRETRESMEAERDAILEVSTLAKSDANKEITRLREQNATMTRLLESHQAKAKEANATLLQNVGRMLSDMTEESQKGLKKEVDKIFVLNEEREGESREFAEKHGRIVNTMSGRADGILDELTTRSGESKRKRDDAFKGLAEASSTFNTELTKMQTTISTSIETYSTETQQQRESMNETYSDAFDRHHRAKRARIESTKTMVSDVQSEYRHNQRSISSTSRNIESSMGYIVSESKQLSNAAEKYRDNTSSHLSSMQKSSQALLDQGTKEDIPTATTPRKRGWDVVDSWPLTESREIVLKKWRQSGMSGVGSETFLAEHLPLPEEEREEGTDVEAPEIPVAAASPPSDGSFDEAIYNPAESLASSVSSSASIAVPIIRAPMFKRKIPTTKPQSGDARTSVYTRSKKPR